MSAPRRGWGGSAACDAEDGGGDGGQRAREELGAEEQGRDRPRRHHKHPLRQVSNRIIVLIFSHRTSALS